MEQKLGRQFKKSGDKPILLRSFISKETILSCNDTTETSTQACNSTGCKIRHNLCRRDRTEYGSAKQNKTDLNNCWKNTCCNLDQIWIGFGCSVSQRREGVRVRMLGFAQEGRDEEGCAYLVDARRWRRPGHLELGGGGCPVAGRESTRRRLTRGLNRRRKCRGYFHRYHYHFQSFNTTVTIHLFGDEPL